MEKKDAGRGRQDLEEAGTIETKTPKEGKAEEGRNH